ncbi:MAG: hypothetical protein PHU63_03900 [Candidatus ainarchaeum sp.]|nr:hypothetical protein [Candidatus ainarchaeum sp.]
MEEVNKISKAINSVNLALDGYEDIFSDFDESPYSNRIISDDFVREIEKRYNENKKGDFEVVFTLPKAVRKLDQENIIKKRIKEHYRIKEKDMNERIEKNKKIGKDRILIGLFMLLVILLLDLSIYKEEIWSQLIQTFLVPAGWFTIWTGYDYFFDRSSELIEKKKFYKKFYDAKYVFMDEESVSERIATIGKSEKNEQR